MENIQLSNNLIMPQIGLGTWQLNGRELVKGIIEAAYELGYCLIDTAAAYSNEIAIGRAIRDLGLDRETLFLSDKVWNTSRGHDAVVEACKKSLKKLKTDYIDLYLIHWPASPKLYAEWEKINADTWRGMETLYREGLVKAIGVCNFKVHHLTALKKTAHILPMVNQVEFHPGYLQNNIYEYCRKNGIVVEASSPLGNGQILQNQVLAGLAESQNKSVAQICLRWAVQKGVIVLPKTSNIKRLSENFDIWDFQLSDIEMAEIDDITYCGGIGIDSDEVTEFG